MRRRNASTPTILDRPLTWRVPSRTPAGESDEAIRYYSRGRRAPPRSPDANSDLALP